ncbi:MAG: aminodeoxychorismate/anthranilate synthase component II [Leptospirales bacterium]|nr:aminodeoxychorismate/anthranilate synthase component II [Leptospirales bacterium]
MKVLIIDNYDSFTYNLYQYAGELLEDRLQTRFQLDVFRNDAISLQQIEAAGYNRLILSPGPGEPSDPAYFGICADILRGPAQQIPLLGVCLGMQGMAFAYGGRVVRAHVPMHGKTSAIRHDGRGVFEGLPTPLTVMRYHSLIVEQATLPECFEVSATAESEGGPAELMGIRHRSFPIEGIQFHPESFATEAGMQMVANFLFQAAPVQSPHSA